MALGVDEASQAYERAMRNIVAAGPGICRVCWGFVDPDFETCYRCGHQPDCLDAIVPITYSEQLGQMHLALRNYKDANSTAIRRHDAIRLAAILWRFLREHESCVARTAGVDGFDLVTIVPSSKPERDKHSAFAELTGWIEPIKARLQRTLEPTGEVRFRRASTGPPAPFTPAERPRPLGTRLHECPNRAKSAHIPAHSARVAVPAEPMNPLHSRRFQPLF